MPPLKSPSKQTTTTTTTAAHLIYPLSLGVTRIGRSPSDNTICIPNKNVSKSHACINLTELSSVNNLLDTCHIWDTNSLNKLKVNGVTLLESNINKDKPYELHLNDQIQFGTIRFKLVRMTDTEKNEQEKKRSHLVDVSLFYENETNGEGCGDERKDDVNSIKQMTNGKSKMASLFEIQNTLDETVPIVDTITTTTTTVATNGNGIVSPKTNGNAKNNTSVKIFIADTESEDEEENDDDEKINEKSVNSRVLNESTADNDKSALTNHNNHTTLNNTSGCGEFHLEMSESIVNQSCLSMNGNGMVKF